MKFGLLHMDVIKKIKNHTKMDGCDQKIKIKKIDENERGPKSSIRFLKRRR